MLSARARGVITSRYRRALTRTAVSAVTAGLPVVPGAWWSAANRRFECDLADCGRTGPHPAVRPEGPVDRLEGWVDGLAGSLDRLEGRAAVDGRPGFGAGLAVHAVREPGSVVARWKRQPYTVLVPTGEGCDVVDVPAELGRSLAVRLDARSRLGPVIAAGSRWFFLTRPGGRLPAFGGDVLVHGRGSWIMLPPSLGPGGAAATWLVRPAVSGPVTGSRPGNPGGWVLPARDDVIRAIAPVTVPGPRSTSPELRQARPTPV